MRYVCIAAIFLLSSCSPAINHGEYIVEAGRTISQLSRDTYYGVTGQTMRQDSRSGPPDSSVRPPGSSNSANDVSSLYDPSRLAQQRSSGKQAQNRPLNGQMPPADPVASHAPVPTMPTLPALPTLTNEPSPLALRARLKEIEAQKAASETVIVTKPDTPKNVKKFSPPNDTLPSKTSHTSSKAAPVPQMTQQRKAPLPLDKPTYPKDAATEETDPDRYKIF